MGTDCEDDIVVKDKVSKFWGSGVLMEITSPDCNGNYLRNSGVGLGWMVHAMEYLRKQGRGRKKNRGTMEHDSGLIRTEFHTREMRSA
jgi:hypothetical protein